MLSGCKGGVGVTTLSLNLAVAMKGVAPRVLVLECHPHRGDLAVMYRLRGEYGLEDAVNGNCSLRDAMTPGPGGIDAIPRFTLKKSLPSSACWQLLRQLDEIRSDFEHIVIDAGSSPTVAEILWPAADDVVVVTTTELVALTDSYALVKSMVQRDVVSNRVSFLVNRAGDPEQAYDVQSRLRRSCQQFLHLTTNQLSSVPQDEYWERAVSESRSVLCANPASPSAVAVTEVAGQLTAHQFANLA